MKPSLSSYGRARTSGDRKSTRLNSSHEWTSYAVFCLKNNQVRGATEAAAASAGAAARVAQARDAGKRSGRDLVNADLFATVVFFAGTARTFEPPRVWL